MKLVRDPFPLVFARGNESTKLACLEFFDLSDSPRAQACLLKLLAGQRSDGAFPSQFDPGTWGTVETVRNTLLLIRLGLPLSGVNVTSAVGFILANQRPDGGWSENRQLNLPSERTWLSGERSITWLTADVVDLLRQVGLTESGDCAVAVEWLRSMQNPQGGWPSVGRDIGGPPSELNDPDATAQITFLMGEVYGEADPVYLKGRDLFEGYLDECVLDVERGYRIRARDGEREAIDVYHVTHLLLPWVLAPPRPFQSGYDAGDRRVKRLMETLVGVQRPDGGWYPFFDDASAPVYTVLAVKALILSGALPREDLKARVTRFTMSEGRHDLAD
jgi:hypothetical protein